MAEDHGSGDPPPQDNDGGIGRSPEVEEVVNQFFPEPAPAPAVTEQGWRGW